METPVASTIRRQSLGMTNGRHGLCRRRERAEDRLTGRPHWKCHRVCSISRPSRAIARTSHHLYLPSLDRRHQFLGCAKAGLQLMCRGLPESAWQAGRNLHRIDRVYLTELVGKPSIGRTLLLKHVGVSKIERKITRSAAVSFYMDPSLALVFIVRRPRPKLDKIFTRTQDACK